MSDVVPVSISRGDSPEAIAEDEARGMTVVTTDEAVDEARARGETVIE